MEESGAIGAGLYAAAAHDAKVPVDHNHPIFFSFVGRPGYGTGQNARRVVAVVTQFGKEEPLGLGIIGDIGEIHLGSEIADGDRVLHLTAYLARSTANTPSDVNKQGIPF